METAKLTLRPTREVIALAHQIAAEANTSVTQMFSSYILLLHRQMVCISA